MEPIATTRMSSKGQVVIPEEIRIRLSLDSGAQFVVIGEGDSVILKRIQRPSIKELKGLLSKARKQARHAGLDKSEIDRAIKSTRRRKAH